MTREVKGRGQAKAITITAKVADSSCQSATLDTKLYSALKVAFASLFGDTTVLNVAPSVRVPLQNGDNNCCFHTILYQEATLSGKLLTTDNAACQRDAERLRLYTVLLAHKDLHLRGGGTGEFPDLPKLYNEWQDKGGIKRPRSPVSAVTSSSGIQTKAPRGEGAATTAEDVSLRSADMIRCRLAVVHTRYWEAIT
jgi:hypothetical protein